MITPIEGSTNVQAQQPVNTFSKQVQAASKHCKAFARTVVNVVTLPFFFPTFLAIQLADYLVGTHLADRLVSKKDTNVQAQEPVKAVLRESPKTGEGTELRRREAPASLKQEFKLETVQPGKPVQTAEITNPSTREVQVSRKPLAPAQQQQCTQMIGKLATTVEGIANAYLGALERLEKVDSNDAFEQKEILSTSRGALNKLKDTDQEAYLEASYQLIARAAHRAEDDEKLQQDIAMYRFGSVFSNFSSCEIGSSRYEQLAKIGKLTGARMSGM